jgi:peptide deformylase
LKLRGLDLEGNRRSVKAHDFLAQLLMHETHHLQGILVNDIAIKRLDDE